MHPQRLRWQWIMYSCCAANEPVCIYQVNQYQVTTGTNEHDLVQGFTTGLTSRPLRLSIFVTHASRNCPT